MRYQQSRSPDRPDGRSVVSNQTDPEGLEVKRLLVAAAVDIERELYLAITSDR